MKTKNLDIVYALKETDEDEELRYSLRSLKNLPHRKVWVYGGKLDWFKNIENVQVQQNGPTKWDNTKLILSKICENDDISPNFIYMNDDFFITKPLEDLPYYFDKTLQDRINGLIIENFWKKKSRYTLRLEETSRKLVSEGKTIDNYELHIPIIFNRKKLKKVLEMYPDIPAGAIRSLYGNNYVKKNVQHSDVKVYGITNLPVGREPDFISTTDVTFKRGRVGGFLKDMFKEKSEYEQ